MLNEAIFFGHALLVIASVFVGLRLGPRALTATLALFGVLANLFVLKQIKLFGLSVTCSDVYMIGGMLGLNLLQEFYGKKVARGAVWISFYSLVLFGVMSQAHLLYLPGAQDLTQHAYSALLKPAPRIIFASFAAYLLSQLLDTEIFGRLKRGPLALRSLISLLICQSVDTILFTLLGLSGLVPCLSQIMLMSFAIKVITITLSAPFVQLITRVIPHEP